MAVSFCASIILVLYPFVSVIIIQAVPFCKSIILALLRLIFIIMFMPMLVLQKKKAMLVLIMNRRADLQMISSSKACNVQKACLEENWSETLVTRLP
jgi:hypothetical protein